eukprot:683944-Pleurochrysis_carterae.AAC.5
MDGRNLVRTNAVRARARNRACDSVRARFCDSVRARFSDDARPRGCARRLKAHVLSACACVRASLYANCGYRRAYRDSEAQARGSFCAKPHLRTCARRDAYIIMCACACAGALGCA